MSIQLSNFKKSDKNIPNAFGAGNAVAKEITVELSMNNTKYIFKIKNSGRFNIERI